MTVKSKSQRQVGLLLSKNSPLKNVQQTKLRSELHSGTVKIKGKKGK